MYPNAMDEWTKGWVEQVQAIPAASTSEKKKLKNKRARERQKHLIKKYDEESDDVRKAVQTKVDQEYSTAMVEWENRHKWSGAKEDYAM